MSNFAERELCYEFCGMYYTNMKWSFEMKKYNRFAK